MSNMNDHLLPHVYRRPVSCVLIQQICRRMANWFAKLDARHSNQSLETPFSKMPIHVVCISDTHNRTPDLPAGDLLIHAGDLSQNGSYAEIQAQLDWLGSKPHRYKVVVGGNHDLFLDQEAFGRRRILRNNNLAEDAQEPLNWGGCHYLEVDSLCLEFPEVKRVLKLFGSPMTPDCRNWAFQYPAVRDIWSMTIPDDCNIVIAHCPPALYGDGQGIGDGYLLREIRRVKPLLAVVGHAHDGYGIDVLYHEGCQSLLDDIALNNRPFWALMGVIWVIFRQFLAGTRLLSVQRRTTVVNAAIAVAAREPRKGPKTPIEIFL